MYTKYRNKYLLIEPSGWEPIRRSLSDGIVTISDIDSFLNSNNIASVISQTAYLAGEFNFANQITLYNAYESGYLNSFSSNTLTNSGIFQITPATLQQNGTFIANDTWNNYTQGEYFNVSILDDDIPKQSTLFEGSQYWQFLSDPDRSYVYLARNLVSSGSEVVVLANDRHLRAQLTLEKRKVRGSSSFLAGMVLTGIYSYQKGTKIFHHWKDIDNKFVPKNYSFKEVLQVERERRNESNSCCWIINKK